MQIAPAALDLIIAHARDEAPAECCGLVLGTADAITDAVRARNVADAPSRFLIDPKDHIDVRRDARRRGLDVVGFYHSHPHSPAGPSETDIAEASYPDHLHVIVSLGVEPPVVKLFRLTNGIFHPVEYVASGFSRTSPSA